MRIFFLVTVTVPLIFLEIVAYAQSTTIYTPKGTAVAALIRSEFTASQIAQINNDVALQWPNTTRIGNASNMYNCHSYAWHLTEGNTSKVWINTPQDDKYWNDGSFIEICNELEAIKISYASDDHSAVRSAQSAALGKYDSKWGNLPVLRHDPAYVPYTSTGRKYYKSTKVIGPAIICSTTTDVVYSTAATAITGATYSWSKSNNIVLNGSGSSVLARAAVGATGLGWVEVAITSPCGGTATSRTTVQVDLTPHLRLLFLGRWRFAQVISIHIRQRRLEADIAGPIQVDGIM